LGYDAAPKGTRDGLTYREGDQQPWAALCAW